MEASELECCLSVENLNSNGVVTKRRTFKSITVVLDRDEFRDIALRIVSSQPSLGETILLEELTIHKRFLQEGKATITPLTQEIQIMFSNCLPNQQTFCRSVIKEFAHAFSCAYIKLWMHLGSLESTQNSKVALGCASSYSYAFFVLSKLPIYAFITQYTHAKRKQILKC